jgi:hypothetical protein
VLPQLPDFRLNHQIADGGSANCQTVLTLETTDFSWQHEIHVSDLSEYAPHWVQLVIPSPPPGQRFNLIYDNKDGTQPCLIFEDVSYGDLLEASGKCQDHAKPIEEESTANDSSDSASASDRRPGSRQPRRRRVGSRRQNRERDRHLE